MDFNKHTYVFKCYILYAWNIWIRRYRLKFDLYLIKRNMVHRKYFYLHAIRIHLQAEHWDISEPNVCREEIMTTKEYTNFELYHSGISFDKTML